MKIKIKALELAQIFYRLARNAFTSVFKITRQPKKLMLHDHEAQIVHSFKFCRSVSKCMLCLFYKEMFWMVFKTF